jgi:hypothetical protein
MSQRSIRFAFAIALFLPGLDASVADGLSFSCARQELPKGPVVVMQNAEPATDEVAKAPDVKPVATPPPPTPRELLRSWLSARMPAGGSVEDDGPTIGVVHTAKKGQTVRALATSYIDLTTFYGEGDLVSAILKANPGSHLGALADGQKLQIPSVVLEVPKTGDAARLGWPKDEGLKGIYANATIAGHPSFPSTLEKMAARGMNALVLDAKDVTGYFTYPSKIPLAVAIKANKHTTIGSLERAVRFAHARGIRVIARVTCFRDENVGPQRRDLAVQKKGGGAHVAPSKIIDWLDPQNEQVQQYLLDVVDESLDAGVDEIQLDYVRYPTEGIWDADFKLKGKHTYEVITDFVKRVHEHTEKAHAALSLDVFGVVAWRDKRDVESTGQDLRLLAPYMEAVSPMVYPSHFADGFNGYAKPGDHPDVVAIGTKRAVEEIKASGAKTVVRPWVQAFPWKTSTFGPQYIGDQIKEAKNGGGSGWLAWNSGGEYGATFYAVPLKKTLVAAK